MTDNNVEIPPKKRRKLNEICGANFLANLSNSNQLEDVTFIVGKEKEKIGGNRTIFALQSSVFRAQLYGKMTEAKSNEIIIEDITPQTFTFLKNIFCGNDDKLRTDIVCDVLYACKKYLLIELECECYKFIENIMDLKDWWTIIQQQQITTDIDMEDALLRKSRVLIKHSDDIVNDLNELVKITPEWVMKLVLCDSFVVSKEEKIWEMCINYCKNSSDARCSQCSLQVAMSNFIPRIRFPLMDKDYFFEKVESSGIVSWKDLYRISKCFIETKKHKFKYDSGFVWYPRTPFGQRFLAQYDIKCLKAGDTILVPLKGGMYVRQVIKSIDWADNGNSRERFNKGLQLQGLNPSLQNKNAAYFCKQSSVASIASQRRFIAMDNQRYNSNDENKDDDLKLDANDNNSDQISNIKLEPSDDQVQSMYKIGNTVSCWMIKNMDENSNEKQYGWVNGVITGYHQHCGWKYVLLSVKINKNKNEQQTVGRLLHPWDFDHLK